jgi:hypothetical protein
LGSSLKDRMPAKTGLPHIIVRSGESVQEVPKRLDRMFGVNRCHYQNSVTPMVPISVIKIRACERALSGAGTV